MTSRSGRLAAVAMLGGVALVLGGCGGEQSTLNPKSGPARDISTLWWWMLGVAGLVFAGAVALLVVGWLRSAPGLPFLGNRDDVSTGLVVAFGLVIPLFILVALFIVANLTVMNATSAPPPGSTPLTVKVIGHRWFWEFRYPGRPAITANELHIPSGTRVRVVGTTADVIHSFWVPELNRKIDLIPGRENSVLLYATHPGVFRGQCAEFCGLQHAHMSMTVFADPPTRFQAWLANESKPRRAPATAAMKTAERTFMTSQCASCHRLRGTTAQGNVGPDLTHFGSRTQLAAETLANNPGNLARWLRNPQAIKPGNLMPDLGLTQAQIGELVPYLEGLK